MALTRRLDRPLDRSTVRTPSTLPQDSAAIESFFFIILYSAMRSVHNNCEPRLETYVRSIFYSFDSLVGLCSPGVRGEPWSWWKTALMSSMGLNFYCTPLRFRNGEDRADTTRPIQALLYDLRGVFSL